MARYADFRYGTRRYGPTTRAVSRSFILAQSVDYGQVLLTLEVEQRIGLGYVLTRTRTGAAEDPSNGVPVASGVIAAPEFSIVDGVSNLQDSSDDNDVAVPSGMVYYTLFVFDSNGSWFKDAATSVVVPRDSGAHEFMASLLPTAYLSEDGNPFGYVPSTSDLYRFLGGFAVTYDELKTALRLVLPTQSRARGTVRRLHDAYVESVGMPIESTIGVAASSRLYRDAGLIYATKGTLSGVQIYTESLTNWNTVVSESTNLLLSLDDASFEQGTGNWGATGATLSRQQVNGGSTTSPDQEYEDSISQFPRDGVCRVTLTGASAEVLLPGDGDRLKSVPVSPGDTYYLKVPVRGTSGTPSITPSLKWLDQAGEELDDTSGTATSTTSSWSTLSVSGVAPTGSRFVAVALTVTGSVSDSVDLDMISLASSDTYYRDPRCVDVICGPARLNLISNPSFESDSSWVADTGSVTSSSEEALVGAKSGKCVGDPFRIVSETIPVLQGFPLTVAGHTKGTGTASILIEFLDAGNNVVSTQEIAADPNSSEWSRSDDTVVPDTEATTLRIALEGSGTVYFDALSLERADRPLIYFDSGVSDQTGEDSKVATKGDNIYSLLYPNRLVKLIRLRQTLPFYLPLGVSARVLLWDSSDPQVSELLPYGV